MKYDPVMEDVMPREPRPAHPTLRSFVRIAGLAFILLLTAVPGAWALAAKEGGGEAAPARKVLVVAKIKEETKRRALEEEARVELQKRGVETILGSDVMAEADFASEDTIRAKVESLGVDGVLAYVPLAVDESVKTSSVSVGIGIGVGGYGSHGGMGMMVGGSVPLSSSSKIVRKVRVRSRFFARPFEGFAWEKVYYEPLNEDTTRLMQTLAYDTVKTLKKKKLIPGK